MTPSPPILVACAAALGLLQAGCGSAAPSGWAGEEADSAGVALVTNPSAPLWSPGAGWWVEEELRLGPAGWGRISDVALGSDGRIYVLGGGDEAVWVVNLGARGPREPQARPVDPGEAAVDTRFPVPGGEPWRTRVPEAQVWAVAPTGELVWTTFDAEELRFTLLEGPDAGELTRIVRSVGWQSRLPTDGDRRALELLAEAWRERSRGPSSPPDSGPGPAVPERLPVLTDLHTGPEGTLWVQRFGSVRDAYPGALDRPVRPGMWGGRSWDVLDADGRYLGSVELPRRFRLYAMGGDRIAGAVGRPGGGDELVVLRLYRGQGGP